jgi:pimeloyl-ACP methyl ester carboxylesterase
MKRVLNGDFWGDRLASTCPALVVRGTQSKVVDGGVLKAMAERRPNTELVSLDAGHVTHHDDPDGFNAAVRRFLGR